MSFNPPGSKKEALESTDVLNGKRYPSWSAGYASHFVVPMVPWVPKAVVMTERRSFYRAASESEYRGCLSKHPNVTNQHRDRPTDSVQRGIYHVRCHTVPTRWFVLCGRSCHDGRSEGTVRRVTVKPASTDMRRSTRDLDQDRPGLVPTMIDTSLD